MTIHDWTRIHAGEFHDFHTAWIGTLRTALNSGVLPEGYYCLGEQVAGPVGPDLLTLARRLPSRPDGDRDAGNGGGGGVATLAPPLAVTRLMELADVTLRRDPYPALRRRLAIRHVSDDRLVALVEILSPGNKASAREWTRLLSKMLVAAERGIHLLAVDLFPPTPRDPQGFHAAFWGQLTGAEPAAEAAGAAMASVRTFAAYQIRRRRPRLAVAAHLEPRGVGEEVPDLPLFLDVGLHVTAPLAESYAAAYVGVPAHLRRRLEEA